jgi:hypothetical protein
MTLLDRLICWVENRPRGSVVDESGVPNLPIRTTPINIDELDLKSVPGK